MKRKDGKTRRGKHTPEEIELVNSPDYIYKCKKCNIDKPNSEYSNNLTVSSSRKLATYCKDCAKKKYIDYYYANHEREKARNLKYWVNNKEREKQAYILKRKTKPLSIVLKNAKGSARMRNLELNITLEHLQEVYDSQKGLCFYTGDEMIFETGVLSNSLSIDRKDSSKGYIIGNVVFCKYQVNIMKSNSTIEHLFEFCEKILNNKNNIIKNYGITNNS